MSGHAQDAADRAGKFRDSGVAEQQRRLAQHPGGIDLDDRPQLLRDEPRAQGPVYVADRVRMLPRDHPAPGTGNGGPAGGSAVVGAKPELLVAFAHATPDHNGLVSGKLAAARAAVGAYADQCAWGHFDVSALFSSVQSWLDANEADARWAEAVAAGFVLAGTAADLPTLEALAVDVPGTDTPVHGELILKLLSGASADELKTFLASHPGLVKDLQQSPPPMPAVKQWWDGLSDVQRTGLVTTVPEGVGNLAGVPYKSRDLANRNWLTKELDQAQKDLEAVNAGVYHEYGADPRGYDYNFDKHMGTLEERLKKLKGLSEALNSGQENNGVRELIQFFPEGSNPKASIASGDLDAATRVGIFTPGMFTTLASSSNNVSGAEQIMDTAERMQKQAHGSHEEMAMVTFMNYDAPDLLAEPSEADAKAGGLRLAGLMDQIKAGKKWSNEDPRLTLIGHSYGTTTEAEALKHTGAGNVVDLASAGVYSHETGIKNIEVKGDTVPINYRKMPSDLQVPAGGIHAGTSSQDPWAPVGVTTGIGRVDPDGKDAAGVVDQFSAGDGQVPAGYEQVVGGDGVLHAPTGHDVRVHADDPKKWGYSDPRTSTNWNSAAILAGLEELEVHP